MENTDLRVKVKFIEKLVSVEGEGNERGKAKTMAEFYKNASGRIFNPGEEALVTRKQAIWLAHHEFIAPIKKTAKK
jgi:hypothetical protein